MIKIATIDNFETIVKNNILIAKDINDLNINEEEIRKGVKAIFDDPDKGAYYLYYIDKQIVGQIYIAYEFNDLLNCNYWWIKNIFINNKEKYDKIIKNFFNYITNLAKDMEVCGVKYLDIFDLNEETLKNFNYYKSIFDLYQTNE